MAFLLPGGAVGSARARARLDVRRWRHTVGIAFVEQEMLRLSEAADPCAMPALAAGWHPSRDVLQETARNGF
jgi:hypothetical protein